MSGELKPDTLRRKQRAAESLEEFLARMTVVWQRRQERLATALERQRVAAARYVERAKARDPEAFAERRRAAVKRYAERHPDRLKAKQHRLSEALSASRAIVRAEKQAQREADRQRRRAERDAKRASRPEGYPKDQSKRATGRAAVTSTRLVNQDPLSRAWFVPDEPQAARPDQPSSGLCSASD
jgi:hypothetical protein